MRSARVLIYFGITMMIGSAINFGLASANNATEVEVPGLLEKLDDVDAILKAYIGVMTALLVLIFLLLSCMTFFEYKGYSRFSR